MILSRSSGAKRTYTSIWEPTSSWGQNSSPGRELYLAVRELVFTELFEEPVGRILLDRDLVRLIVFDDKAEEILQWIP